MVNFALDRVGAKRFADVSTQHVGEPFAIVLDNKVISAPVIREPILGGQGQISGNFTVEGANDLAVLLRAGALPAPLTVVEEQSIGSSLGADSIRSGVMAVAVGFVLMVAFILAIYGLFGGFAAVALVANLALTLAGLSLLGATLTLPGMAGILLALGMAVDANILINERAREEARKTSGVASAIETGFRKAYRTILDANATTLIKMLILLCSALVPSAVLPSPSAWAYLCRCSPRSFWSGCSPLIGSSARGQIPAHRHGLPHIPRGHRNPVHEGSLLRPDRLGGDQLGLDRACHISGTPHGRRVRRRHCHRGPRAGPGRPRSFARQAWLHRSWPGASSGIRIRERRAVALRAPNGQAEAQQIAIAKARSAVQDALSGAEFRRVEVIGPTIGSELLRDGLWALAWAALAMFVYIAFRFEWPFAVGAVATMFLDLTKTLGLCLDGVRVQPDLDRRDPYDHGLFDQRQDRRLRPRA